MIHINNIIHTITSPNTMITPAPNALNDTTPIPINNNNVNNTIVNNIINTSLSFYNKHCFLRENEKDI